MLDANRKRSDRDATLILRDQALADLNDNHLAIVPVGVSPVSPPPKREPKMVKANEGKDGTSVAAKPSLAGPSDGRRWAQ